MDDKDQINPEKLLSDAQQLNKAVWDTAKALRELHLTIIESKRRNLTENEKRIIEYFWNKEKQKIRSKLPFLVIHFFESDLQREGVEIFVTKELIDSLKLLKARDFIQVEKGDTGDEITLTRDGALYLTRQHPTVLMYWERVLQLMPSTLSLIVAIIGLIASVFGIVQFIDWVSKW